MTRYAMGVEAVTKTKNAIVVWAASRDAEDWEVVIAVYRSGQKFKVKTEMWEGHEPKWHTVDADGLAEWLTWAAIGKTRRESVMRLLDNPVSQFTELTSTGKVKSLAWVKTALRKGRTFSSIIREGNLKDVMLNDQAIADQLSTMSVEQITEVVEASEGQTHAVRSKLEVEAITRCWEIATA